MEFNDKVWLQKSRATRECWGSLDGREAHYTTFQQLHSFSTSATTTPPDLVTTEVMGLSKKTSEQRSEIIGGDRRRAQAPTGSEWWRETTEREAGSADTRTRRRNWQQKGSVTTEVQ